MASTDPATTFDSLMERQQFAAAARLAESMKVRDSRNFQWWLGAGRAMLAQGRLREAEEEFQSAARRRPGDERVELQLAIVAHRLARSADAIDRLRKLIAGRARCTVDATIVLAEVLHRANRRNELSQLIAQGGAWLEDPRAVVYIARSSPPDEAERVIESLCATARGNGPAHLRRIAGFDAVKMLDSLGRYREAFDLAAFLHASTGTRCDVGELEEEIACQKRELERPSPSRARAFQEVSRTALIVGLPRSGTTLIEQMLDRHSLVTGIGEYDGVHRMAQRAQELKQSSMLDAGPMAEQLSEMQRDYLVGAAALRRDPNGWTLDKGLHAWRHLPLVARVLPQCVFISIDRDPRDCAISALLGNFHPTAFGWTASLASIHRVMCAYQSIVAAVMAKLECRHESLIYEALVADPLKGVQRCLSLMNLEMESATLAPEENSRTVLTLSHEQVRRPINAKSIGRWRNYDFAFDSSWDLLASQHQSRLMLAQQ